MKFEFRPDFKAAPVFKALFSSLGGAFTGLLKALASVRSMRGRFALAMLVIAAVVAAILALVLLLA